MADGKDIIGAGGGKDKGQRQPIEAPDSLHSVAYARVLDVISEGPIKGLVNGLKSVYYNETPIENADGTRNFQRVQVDWRLGTQDQDPIPGFGTVENEIAVGVELKSTAAWTQAINNPALDGVRVRLSVPMLTKTDTSTGDTNGNSIEYAIDIATDGGAFVEVLVTAITGKTTSKYERSHRLDLPKALTGWVIRVRRLTADSTSGTNISASYIESYTELVDAKVAYPNSALLSHQVDASQFQSVPSRASDNEGRIIRVPSNYDPETRTYTGLWDGTFKVAYTNNPAWIFYDLVTHKRYGLGHLVDAAQVNKWALYSIARWCDELVPDGQGGTEPRLTCNVYLQTQEDAYKVLSDLAGAFRGVAYWAAGAIQPSADMPADPVYPYTPANVVDGKFEYSGSGRRARHTVALVSWNDIRDFGRSKVEYVEDLDGIARYGINQTEIISIGCTSRSQARRHGKMVLATERLETDLVTFRIGLNGTFCAPGQVIQIADPLRMGDRLGGRISSATATTITVDRLPETLPVAGDKINVIGTDGNQAERTIASVAGNVISVTAAFDAIPVPHSMWMVERTDLSAPMYRVLAVTEEDDGVYGVTALLHRPDKYAFVDSNEPLDDVPLPLDTSVAPVETITVQRFDRTTEYATETVVAADWQRPTGALEYDVQWRKDEGEWIKLPRQVESRIEVTNARPGTYLFRVAAVNAFGKPSLMRYSDSFSVVDDQPAPEAISELRSSLAAAEDEILAQLDAVVVEAETNVAAIQQVARNLADEVEARALAQAERDAAFARLSDRLAGISDDNVLTPDEKPQLIRDYQILIDERDGLVAQGTASEAYAERNAYINALDALSAYLNTLTTPVPWNNVNGITFLT